MSTIQVLGLAGLGAFHGLNPAMGWLFAVARGMQERRPGPLLAALGPIAAGHLASVWAVAFLITATSSVGASTAVAVVGGVALVGFGLWKLLRERHFRWRGMRLTAGQLTAWSFLMSSAHGAGLMLVPFLVAGAPAGHHHAAPDALAAGLWTGLGAALVHTAAMLAVAAAVALVVYAIVGVAVLRRSWFNVDRLWAFALIGAGCLTLASQLA